MIRSELIIINRLGLHARAAAKFVTQASQFASSVRLERDGQQVNGKSIMGVMMLAAGQGTRLELEVSGEDEERASARLRELVQQRFGEDE